MVSADGDCFCDIVRAKTRSCEAFEKIGVEREFKTFVEALMGGTWPKDGVALEVSCACGDLESEGWAVVANRERRRLAEAFCPIAKIEASRTVKKGAGDGDKGPRQIIIVAVDPAK